MPHDWNSHNRGQPCPVCRTSNDRCSSRADGLTACRTHPAPADHTGFRLIGPAKDGTGLLYARTDAVPITIPSKADKPARDWGKLHHFFRTNLTPDRMSQLAGALALPVSCLAALPVGYAPRDRAFAFAEVDATGKIIGINRRFTDGTKRMITGSSRGLYVPRGWNDGDGPVLVVEGASDTLACVAAGLQAVGRPSALGGVEHLVRLFASLPTDREILVVGENDSKASGLWPGKEGAISVARQLSERLKKKLKWSLPPEPYKDTRAWLVATGKVNRG